MRPRLPHAPPAWWQNLPAGMGTLSLLPNKDGGIIDDCIVTNAGDHLYMVINAGHEDKDLPHLAAHLADFVQSGKDASMETLPRNGLVAVQGPKAAEVLQRLVPDVELADKARALYGNLMGGAALHFAFGGRRTGAPRRGH